MLRELYQEMIVDHGKQPRNFGKLLTATHAQVGHNPLCGDKLIVYIEKENDNVNNIKFEGTGCAICMASASLMTESVKGKSVNEIEHLFHQFHRLVTLGEKNDDALESMGKLAVFAGVAEFPIRVKCATLAWHTLKGALSAQSHFVTTE
jgi:nitrogen fixation NifU-like protein